MTAHDVQDWLVLRLAKELRLDPAQIDPTRLFTDYGLDSVNSVTVLIDLEDWLGGGELPSSLMWDYKTVEALAAHVVERHAPRPELCAV